MKYMNDCKLCSIKHKQYDQGRVKINQKNVRFPQKITAMPCYNAVRLALICYYAAIAFKPFLGRARFPLTVMLFPLSFNLEVPRYLICHNVQKSGI
jgi:hypothetical protein